MKGKISVSLIILCCLLITADAFSESWRRGKITFVRRFFPWKDDEVYIMNADGSDVTMLMDWDAHFSFGPFSLSPDCKQVVFDYVRQENPKKAIYVMDLESKKIKKISKIDHEVLTLPRWSPDGEKIICMGHPDLGVPRWIYVMNVDGSNPKKIYEDMWLRAPDWSPDGRRIAFFFAEGGGYGIYVMDIKKGIPVDILGRKRISTPLDPVEGYILRWSPDGRRITFGDGKDIYIINSDGTGLKKLTDSDADDRSPCWSPDGRKIAFVSNRDGVFHIYVMNPDGTDQKRLTNNKGEETYRIDWRSPLGVGLEPILLKKELWGNIKLKP